MRSLLLERFSRRQNNLRGAGRVEIDWSHPLASMLRAYVPGTERRGLPYEAVSRSTPDSGVVLSGPDGSPGTADNGWLDRHAFMPGRILPLFRGGLVPGCTWSDALSRHSGITEGANLALTAAMFVSPFAQVASTSAHWGKLLTGGGGGGWALGKGATQLWSFTIQVGAGSNTAGTATAITLGDPYFVVGRCRYPNLDLRVVNLRTGLIETGTGTVSGVPSDTTAALNWGPRTGAGNRVDIGVSAMWKRYLTDSEVDRWFDDPWQMLVEVVPRRWFLPVPPAGTNTNITPDVGLLAFTGIAPIVQETIVPGGIGSAEAFGTHALIDPTSTIGASAIASAEAFGGHEVFGDPGAAGTVSPTAIPSAEAFGNPTITEVATLYPTGIPSGFDMDLHSVGVAVGTIAPFGIASEEAFSDPVSSPLGTTGGTTLFTLSNAAPPASGTVTGKKLCSPFTMLRAGLYDTAPSPAEILPDVYGDFSVGGLRGPAPAVLVTQTSPWIFIAAAHAVQSIDKVYIDDVEQTSGFVTIPAIALGGGPQVAVIAFTTQPTGQVSWRGKGKMDSTGALIEDPILQLENMLLMRGGYASTDFDATTLAEAKSKSSLAAWKTAFVFQDERQIQEWITEVLFNVMGFWRVTGRAQLQLALDPGGAFSTADLVDSIIAARDCLDGDDGVTFVADREQLVNRLVANYRYCWQEGRYTEQLADDTVADEISINAYGEVRKEVTLRGLRDAALVANWASILFERQAFEQRVEGALVTFSIKGPRLIHATVGDLIAFTWPYGPTRESGNPYVNQILRIVQINHDFTRGGLTQVTAVDTGSYVTSGGTRLLTPYSM